MDPTLQAAWVAVTGTLLGALVGGGLQAWVGRNAVRSARNDAAEQRKAAQHALDVQMAEERSRRLWAERRLLYAKVLAGADLWHKANLDLQGVDLPQRQAAEMGSATMRAAEAVSPEGAAALRCMHEFGRLAQEVQLIGDAEVRGAVEAARTTLRDESRSAVTGDAPAEGPSFGEVLGLLTLAMRRELIHGTAAGDPPNA